MAMNSQYPDEGTLPSSGSEVLDRSGIKDAGYLNKKGTPSGEDAHFNMLPPGTNIEEQKVADIRPMTMKQLVDLSYPGDGWE